MAFFVLSFYLFVSCFFYSGGAVLFLLALAFAGIFIGLSAAHQERKEVTISYLTDHRKSFFSILLIVLVVIVSAGLSFKYTERLVSVSYFSKTLNAPTLPAAEASIGNALRLYENDLYLRTYADVYLLKLNSLVSKEESKMTDEDKTLLQQSSLDQAVSGARLATNFNSKNYLNFQALGGVYQRLVSFGIKDTYEKSIEAYKMAVALNPLNPGLHLDMASVSLANKKNTEAKDYANAAISLKSDYIDPYIILSQVAKAEGQNTLAVQHAEKALSFAPGNADLIKYVDSLKNGTSAPAPAPTTSGAPTTNTKKP